jgi:hypothetical protein
MFHDNKTNHHTKDFPIFREIKRNMEQDSS